VGLAYTTLNGVSKKRKEETEQKRGGKGGEKINEPAKARTDLFRSNLIIKRSKVGEKTVGGKTEKAVWSALKNSRLSKTRLSYIELNTSYIKNKERRGGEEQEKAAWVQKMETQKKGIPYDKTGPNKITLSGEKEIEMRRERPTKRRTLILDKCEQWRSRKGRRNTNKGIKGKKQKKKKMLLRSGGTGELHGQRAPSLQRKQWRNCTKKSSEEKKKRGKGSGGR